VTDCESPIKARGLCVAHYYRDRRYGSTQLPPRRPVARPHGICTVDNCSTRIVGQGLCRRHYSRLGRTGSPVGVLRKPRVTNPCLAPGCAGRTLTARGKYCSQRCYRQNIAHHRGAARDCAHCTERFAPLTPSQKNCFTCLGPPSHDARGATRYPGSARLKIYGVSHPEWLKMVARHGGRCWICRTGPAEALDHCHRTGQPRGALCTRCNTILHAVEADGWVAAAGEYLRDSGREIAAIRCAQPANAGAVVF
jgi:hypothetical protein